MTTLFCDLDNTIIFSHRKMLDAPKRVAERLNGAEQSYITERTFRFLSGRKDVSVIPVTARTVCQYERVKGILEAFHCEYALLMNGAVLIKNGAVDQSWLDESAEMVKCSAEKMNEAAQWLKNEGTAELKYHDIFLAYAKAPNPEELSNSINRVFGRSLIYSFFDSRKVYCAPAALTKGNAVKRLSNLIKPEMSFAVGDSENDLSMFDHVDVPIVPQKFEAMVSNQRKVIAREDQVLSDAACDAIETLFERIGNTAADERE